jgi:hypothetical protein
MLDQSRTPHVSPELLRRSAGMSGGGVVSCGTCGAVVPLATAGIARHGYRCQACSDHVAFANGSVILRNGLTAPATPRAARRRSRAGSELISIGVIVLVLGAIAAPLLFWWIGVAAMVVGSLTAVVGITRRNAPY